MTIHRITIALFMGLFLVTSSAFAETGIIKRVKCKEAVYNRFGSGIHDHRNASGTNRIISLQVIRDGCRPKIAEFTFYVVESSGTSLGINMERLGRYTDSITFSQVDMSRAFIVFGESNPSTPSGTFDYTYTID